MVICRLGDKSYFSYIKCPETRCTLYFPSEKDTYKITDYDALLFHGPEFFKDSVMPTERSPSQVYVYATQEAPRVYWHNLMDFKSFYNWTGKNEFGSSNF